MEMSRGAEREKKRALLKQRYQPKSTGQNENVKTIIDFSTSFYYRFSLIIFQRTWPYQDIFYLQSLAEVKLLILP